MFGIIPVADSTGGTGIIPVADSTGGTIRAVFRNRILISSSFKSAYIWNFSVMVLWLLRIATSVKCDCLTVLLSMTMSCLLS